MSQAEDTKTDENVSRTLDDTETILKAENLSKYYGDVTALEGINLEIKDNEVFAIVGDNGAGKSTFVKILSGVVEPSSGEIQLRSPDGLSPIEGRSDRIETVFQDLRLSEKHDVGTNVFVGHLPTKSGLFNQAVGRIDRETIDREANSSLKDLGIDINMRSKVQNLSGGERQAVAISRALVADPEILLLDEPTSEVSTQNSERILDLIRELKDQGETIVFITHNMEEVFEVADRVAVFRNGNLVGVVDVTPVLDHATLVSLMTGASLEDVGLTPSQ
jgi:ABC-type sugar transport system ATPase subunit